MEPSTAPSPTDAAASVPLTIDVVSDVVCPWCYIGKRRFEAALDQFEHRDEVTVMWRSYELDPEAPAVVEGSAAERLAGKYGVLNMIPFNKVDGLDFRRPTWEPEPEQSGLWSATEII